VTAEPAAQQVLRLGRRSFAPARRLVMGIVNRTPDSFYDRGATWDTGAAMARVHAVVAEGADILDIGGVAAAPGAPVDVAEEIPPDRAVRGRGPGPPTRSWSSAWTVAAPGRPGSLPGWRGPAQRHLGRPGPGPARVAAEFGVGLICAQRPVTRLPGPGRSGSPTTT